MRRTFYSLLIQLAALIISSNAFAQSLILSDINNITINNGDTIVSFGDTTLMISAGVNVKNISSINKTIDVRRTKLIEVQGTYCYFTWGLNIFDTSSILSLGNPIDAGEIDSSFYSLYHAFNVSDSSLYRYNFFDENNPSDSSWVFIKYSIINYTGIEENALANLSIYPNPSNGLFYISFTSSIKSEISTDIYNSTGELIISKCSAPSNKPFIVDLQNFPDGNYYLKIFDKKNQFYKILKAVKIQ